MSRSKKLYILLGILVVACVITFAVSRIEQHKENIKNSDEIVMEVDGDTVETLSWSCDAGDYAFHKDGTWQYDEDEEFPVSQEKIADLLEIFEEFGVSFVIEDVEDYGQYGLDNPVCTINFAAADAEYEVKLGDYSTMDYERYVSIGDGNVYLVTVDPLDSFNVELSELIDNDETPSYSEIQEVAFAGTDSDNTYTISYQEEGGDSYREDDVYFTTVGGSSIPLDTTRVESYLRSIRNLDLTNYVTYKATDEDLAAYGLDAPELTVTIQYTPEEDAQDDDGTFTLSISRDPAELQEEAEAEEDAEAEAEEITAYARVGESAIIYQITSDEYTTLMAASYNDLRHAEIIPAEVENISQIDITLEGSVYTITAARDEDDLTWYLGEEELEADDLTSALSALSADSFTNTKPSGKEEISLTIHLDTDDDTTLQLTLYRYDGSDCLAVLDGEPLALVERSRVVDLVEAVNAIVLN